MINMTYSIHTLSKNRKVCVTLFLDFYFDGAHYLIPRVKRHYLNVQYFFDKIFIVTLDNRNFTKILGGNRMIHHPLLPLRSPNLVRGLLGTLAGVVELVKIARLERNIVFFSSPYALYSVLASRILKIPLIVHFKYDPTTQPPMKLGHWIKQYVLNIIIMLALRSAHMVVVTTPRLKRIVINRGVPEEKIFISPNYVDEDLFSPNISGDSIREKLSITQDENIILYMGRLSSEKGLDVLIEAFSTICEELYDTKLLIVGSGPEKGRLEEKCQKLGLYKKVLFLKPVPHALVPNFLAASNVVVLPSYSEGHPKFLIEAMIMGKPIVATDVIGINDTVRNGREAILVKPGDSNALAEALKTLLKDKKLACILGYNARKKALHMYSKKAVIKIAEECPFLIAGF